MVRLISDSERFKLLHGPYAAPKFRIGESLACEYRGRVVKVRGITDAPIPWPSVRRSGNHSPIVCADLVDAIRTESALAVSYHWGVAKETVWKWRKSLQVARNNEGTRRLHKVTQPERWDPQSLARARRKSLTPKARAKMSASHKGRPVHPHFRAAAAEAARRPKPESFKRKLSRRMRREWRLGSRRGHPPGRKWTQAETARVGADTDEVIGRELGRTKGAVQRIRLSLGIPCFRRNIRVAKGAAGAIHRPKHNSRA